MAAAGIGLASVVSAAAEQASYAMSVAGIRAGTLAFDGSQSGGTYAARGSARSSGLVGAIFDFKVDVAASGTVDGNRYRPRSYVELTRESDGEVRKEYRFDAAGTPSITRDPPREKPRRHAADPARQKGVVDPMTAAYAILRDRPEALACALDIAVFDGARRARIRLSRRAPAPGGMICHGEYVREAGFSPEEMAERRVWPVTVMYERQPDSQYRVRDIRFPTSIGEARLRRQ